MMEDDPIVATSFTQAAEESPGGITPERITELSKELGFLDLCALVLAYSKTTTMNISWRHPSGVTLTIKAPRAPKKSAGTAAKNKAAKKKVSR